MIFFYKKLAINDQRQSNSNFKPFLSSQLGERNGARDIRHGISTSGYQEEDHCLQVENLILQHESPRTIESVFNKRT